MAVGTATTVTTSKAIHDLTLRLAPEGFVHEPCEHCDTAPSEAAIVSDTATQPTAADIQAAVTAAVESALSDQKAAHDAEIAKLQAELEQRDLDESTKKAVADALAPVETKLAETQDALDAALVAQKAATDERDGLKALIDAEADKATQAALRVERVAAVKDTGIFPEDAFNEEVAANKDRIDGWVGMDAAVFDALIDGYKAAKAGQAGSGDQGPIPTGRTALNDTVAAGEGKKGSPTTRLFESMRPAAVVTKS